MRRFFASSILILLVVMAALAEGTHTWEQSSFDDFEKGTATGVAVRSDGALELAPSFKPLYTTPSTYIWAVDTDAEGNVYAASGSPARVYRITPEGKASVIFAPQELQVQSLIVDPKGVIYAATSPDGKVYKIQRGGKSAGKRGEESAVDNSTSAASPAGSAPQVQIDKSYSSSVFFNPETKYIWDLAMDKQGTLYVATGDHGEIFRVSKNGEHSVFFKSDEAHIRVLTFDSKGDLIAGSDGSGLIYRIAPSGDAFVLYSAPKKEITALAVDSGGNIYAAGVGEKRAPSSAANQVPGPMAVTPVTGPQLPTLPPNATPGPVFSTAVFATAGGSEIYRIAPDGSPSRIWSSRDDLVYVLGFDQRGTLLAGTGNKGRVFAITGASQFTDLLKASANQVTAFAKAPNGGLYACASNFGKIFLLGPNAEAEGSYESDVFDAHIFSRWGRPQVRATGSVDFYARSGNVDNPDRNWSPWEKIDMQKEIPVTVPSARFVQWKAVLHDGKLAPHLDSVVLNYLPKNVAPDIDDVGVQVGTRYQPVPKQVNAQGGQQQQFDAAPPSIRDRGAIAVRWNAHDDNDDQLTYSLFYRGDGDSRWLLLKDNIDDKFYSFDASLLPDGGYTMKVVASDAPSHSPNEALTAAKESSRFEVDTTPPMVQDLRASAGADGKVHVSFRAMDGYSPIRRAEYSIDAQDWQYVEPVGEISDSRTENYDFAASVPGAAVAEQNGTGAKVQPTAAPKEHVIVVRAYDRFDNMGSAKIVLRPLSSSNVASESSSEKSDKPDTKLANRKP